MKPTVRLLLVMLILPLSSLNLPVLAFGTSTTAQNTEVGMIMEQYFAAMINGDIETLRMLMGGALLHKRAALMDNPEYPAYLAKTYMNATFNIHDITTTDPQTVIVDATINFGQNENIEKRYVLERSASPASTLSYHIIAEHSIAK